MWPFKKRQPALALSVHLLPDGRASIALQGPQGDALGLLALCYLAKIRWLLSTEPKAVLDSLMQILLQAVERWPRLPSPGFIHRLPYMQMLSNNVSPGDWTVPGGELFSVRFFQSGSAHVENDIPSPGLSVNIAWHYAHVLSYCVEHLDQDSLATLCVSIRRFGDHLFSGNQQQGISGLVYLNRIANDIWHQVRSAVDESRADAFDVPWAWEVVGAFGEELESIGEAYAVSERRLRYRKEEIRDAFRILLATSDRQSVLENLGSAYGDLSFFVSGPLGDRAEEVSLTYREKGLAGMTEEEQTVFSQITKSVAEESQLLANELKELIQGPSSHQSPGLSPAGKKFAKELGLDV